jgi:hypothetical protein
MCRAMEGTDSMTNRTNPVKIVIVDDHPMVRESLTLRLSTQTDCAARVVMPLCHLPPMHVLC